MKPAKTYRFEIDRRPVSWNALYSSPHWSKRTKIVAEWRWIVLAAVRRAGVAPIRKGRRVDILIEASMSGTPLDSDNICSKLIIDGLVAAGIFDGDSPKFVRRVATESRHGKPDVTVVTLTEVT